jgi:hypothetical protein
MLRDNLAGLIEPMIDCAGAHALGGHPKQEPTGGCSRSTELTIVVLERSWRHVFRWKTGQRAENGKPPAFEVTTAAHDSRAVATAQHQSHRTIDPQCLKKSPPRRGGIYALTENVSSPFHAEPRQCRERRTRLSTHIRSHWPQRRMSVKYSIWTVSHLSAFQSC